MNEQTTEIREKLSHETSDVEKHQARFTEKILRYNAIVCSNRKEDNFDADKAVAECEDNMKALNAQNCLQEMLVAQMTSVHLLQQMTIALASRSGLTDNKQSYTNAATKLTNCFTQQAALLARLQGVGGQKIVVEHVEVHHGGQAVVGNINGVPQPLRQKNENDLL